MQRAGTCLIGICRWVLFFFAVCRREIQACSGRSLHPLNSMALIDTLKSICQPLAPLGWKTLFARHGLDISQTNLDAELARPLTIDRSIPGFEDFALEGVRGIEPGNPARSLFFHALASPRARTQGDGTDL